MDGRPHETPKTLIIHYQLIRVAKELVESAKGMEVRGDPASLSGGRARCATAIFLACSALEACANVLAGLHYDGPRGKTDAVEAGWPRSAKGRSWHRKFTGAKWQDMAKLVPDEHFRGVIPGIMRDLAEFVRDGHVAQVPDDWDEHMKVMFSLRNEIIVHFKGLWGPAGLEDAYNSLNTGTASYWNTFALRMIEALREGYQQKYNATIM